MRKVQPSKRLRLAYSRFVYHIIKRDIRDFETMINCQSNHRSAFYQTLDLENQMASHFDRLYKGYSSGLLSYKVKENLTNKHFHYRDILCERLSELA